MEGARAAGNDFIGEGEGEKTGERLWEKATWLMGIFKFGFLGCFCSGMGKVSPSSALSPGVPPPSL